MKKFVSLFAIAVLILPAVSLADSTVTASATGSSSITPNGSIVVPTGVTQTFNISGASNVIFDGASEGAINSIDFTGINNDTADHTITAIGGGGAGMIFCSGPFAPGWNVSLPNGGCPVVAAPVYAPSVNVQNSDGSYSLYAAGYQPR